MNPNGKTEKERKAIACGDLEFGRKALAEIETPLQECEKRLQDYFYMTGADMPHMTATSLDNFEALLVEQQESFKDIKTMKVSISHLGSKLKIIDTSRKSLVVSILLMIS